MKILGLSAFYHDSAAVLVVDGEIISAVQEERFTRIKNDESFPSHSINFCLSESDLNLSDIDFVVFYDKPLIKFERLLETYISYAPKGFKSFVAAMPIWLKDKLFLKQTIISELKKLNDSDTTPTLLFSEHHLSHAASAFYPSPFKEAAILCLDGVGEWATSSVWLGKQNKILPIWEINFPHSLGLLYSAFTYYTGFRVNSGEYKLMGLAPYGEPKYVDLILDNLIDVKDDGTFRLDMSYFGFATGLTMTNKKFHKLFEGEPRKMDSEITQKDMDIARSIQVVIETVILKLANTIHKELKVDYLCLAGGVALNCVANGKLLNQGPFKDIWIQPAAGDSGGALGAALSVWYEYLDNIREVDGKNDKMKGSYLGGSFTNDYIEDYLKEVKASYEYIEDEKLFLRLAKIINGGHVVGWFNGRMEFGPRALGARSIIGDPRSKTMQSTMNLKIKYRESFRPFAPAVLFQFAKEWFEIEKESPYMLLVSNVKNNKLVHLNAIEKNFSGLDKLNTTRSLIPAVTHVDNSARVQTVHKETNQRFFHLLSEFNKLSGCPVLINTSFNVRGEPIVYSPEDAFKCFMSTEMDFLVMENMLLDKKDQRLENIKI